MGPRGATRHSACPVLRHSESGPLGLSVRECVAAGSASGQTACPIHPTLCQSGSRHGHSSPLRSSCLSPPLLPVWMYVSFLYTWYQTPCHSIFCQFWLCEEAQCVYLRCHLGSPRTLFSKEYSQPHVIPQEHRTGIIIQVWLSDQVMRYFKRSFRQ